MLTGLCMQSRKTPSVVFMWAGFENTLHAYILMVFCLFFGAADAKMITGEF